MDSQFEIADNGTHWIFQVFHTSLFYGEVKTQLPGKINLLSLVRLHVARAATRCREHGPTTPDEVHVWGSGGGKIGLYLLLV